MLTDRRTVLVWALFAGLGAAIVAMLPWVDVAGGTSAAGSGPRTGGDIASAVIPSALAIAAGGLAGVLAGGVVRRFCGLVVAACGVLVALTSARVALDPGDALGLDPGGSVPLLPWPWVAAVLGALAVVPGVAMTVARWSRTGSRYDRTREAGPSGRPRTEWDRLSAGEDPTL